MKLTINDNILSDKYFPIISLRFNSRGKVSAQLNIRYGAYTFPDMIGWDLSEIQDWLNFDSTGKHPEIYHEVVQ